MLSAALVEKGENEWTAAITWTIAVAIFDGDVAARLVEEARVSVEIVELSTMVELNTVET